MITLYPAPCAAGVCLLLAAAAFAHPGGLDKNGGHMDHKTGQYHIHRPAPEGSTPAADEPPAPQAEAPRSTEELRKQQDQDVFEAWRRGRVRAFVMAASERQASSPASVGVAAIPQNVRQHILDRDGHRCLICSKTRDLDVDHRWARINGGSNRPDNLATLCQDCIALKAEFDDSIRRSRELR